MEHKGKPVTTSVPSISVKFHANAEQLEELYASDEECATSDFSVASSGAGGASESDSSPLRYLPRLVKRSTSIDITPSTAIDASPPSDPWRFFSDIKGKITKSVEEKITEIKTRSQEEGSPLKNKTKECKDNSSLSDSEDLSESSISKTCGIVSTTEGAEMSSDDDTPSIENDKKVEEPVRSFATSSGLRHRFRLLKPKSITKEGIISKKGLTSLYNINTDQIEQALPEETDVESAVDALEDENLQNELESTDKILKGIEQQFDNIKIDSENVINIKEISGSEVKSIHWSTKLPKTIYAPVGFVDFRTKPKNVKHRRFLPLLVVSAFIVTYMLIYKYSTYLAGFMVGGAVTFLYYYIKYLLDTPSNPGVIIPGQQILEVQAVKEFKPLAKHEGWVNEFPENYNPHTYHISQTQSVYLRLQGNLLRISHTKSKVPKRALWNEPKTKPTFTHHRIYNLLGAQVTLLPEGLAKKRHWSKKYPICITLSKNQMYMEPSVVHAKTAAKEDGEETPVRPKRFGFVKKKRSQTLRFSKLSEENEEFEMDSENSRGSTPSPEDNSGSHNEHQLVEENSHMKLEKLLQEDLHKDDENEVFEDDFEALTDDWGTVTPPEEESTSTKLYLFGRTDREKEDWFRRFKAAIHKGASVPRNKLAKPDYRVSTTLIDKAIHETDYMKYMMIFNKVPLCAGVEYPNQTKMGNRLSADSTDENPNPNPDVQWINAFVGRILFDCLRDDSFTQRVKDKIQKKLTSIKLPYFIEGLVVTELSLGKTPPLIHKAAKPVIDDRGLWIDLDITYEGLIILILQTKLNLMKLKQPPQVTNKENERLAIFNSDVEDSAESTSDEEAMCLLQPALDASGVPVQGLGGTSNTSKKFMKMVDRIAESKFFQAATEYRYIKKAMEGVSNTELRLRVEVKELVGTLVFNVPPPPSDRVWIGFRPTPNLELSAHPIVGERNITFLRITSWIEKKLLLEFQKIMVIPNMEDFIVPVMSPRLPE